MPDGDLTPQPRMDEVRIATRCLQIGCSSPGTTVCDVIAVAPTSGMYRLSLYKKLYDSAALTVNIGWTDNVGAQSVALSDRSVLIVWCLAGHGITAQMVATGAGSFDMVIILEPL